MELVLRLDYDDGSTTLLESITRNLRIKGVKEAYLQETNGRDIEAYVDWKDDDVHTNLKDIQAIPGIRQVKASILQPV